MIPSFVRNKVSKVVVVFALALTGCSGGGGDDSVLAPESSSPDATATSGADATSGSGSGSEGGSRRRLFVNAAGAEIENASTGTITPADGGAISVTASNGTVMTVKVPANTVKRPITITVTPVTSLVVDDVEHPTVGAVVITPPVVLPVEATLEILPVDETVYEDWDFSIPIGFDDTSDSRGLLVGLDDLPPIIDDTTGEGDVGDEGGEPIGDGDEGVGPDTCRNPFVTYTDNSGTVWNENPSGPPWWSSEDGRDVYARTYLPDYFQNCPRPPCPSLTGSVHNGQWYVDPSGGIWEATVDNAYSVPTTESFWYPVTIMDAESAARSFGAKTALNDVPGFAEECGTETALSDGSGTLLPPEVGEDGAIVLPIDGLTGVGLIGATDEEAEEILNRAPEDRYAALAGMGMVFTSVWNARLDGDPNFLEGSAGALFSQIQAAIGGEPGAILEELRGRVSDYDLARAILWTLRLEEVFVEQGVDIGADLDEDALAAAERFLDSLVGWLQDDIEDVESPEFSGVECLDEDGDDWCDETDGDLVDDFDDADGDGVPNIDDEDDDGDGVPDSEDETPYGYDAYYFDFYFEDGPVDEVVGDINGDGWLDYYEEWDFDGDGTPDCSYYYSFGEFGYFEHTSTCGTFEFDADWSDEFQGDDLDLDGWYEFEDCDDSNPDVNPWMIEVPNGIDDDCDAEVDELDDGGNDMIDDGTDDGTIDGGTDDGSGDGWEDDGSGNNGSDGSPDDDMTSDPDAEVET